MDSYVIGPVIAGVVVFIGSIVPPIVIFCFCKRLRRRPGFPVQPVAAASNVAYRTEASTGYLEPGNGRAGHGQPSYGQPGNGHAEYSQPGYGQPGYGQGGYTNQWFSGQTPGAEQKWETLPPPYEPPEGVNPSE